MAQKAAAVSQSMEDDVQLTQEEQSALQSEETEQPQSTEQAPEQAPAKGKKHEEAVPYDRFEALNERLKTAEQQLTEGNVYRERWARLEERQRQAAEAQQAVMAEAERARALAERPDPNLDPSGARAWDAEQRAIRAEQGLLQLNNWLQQNYQATQAQNANYEMQNWLAFQVPQARANIPNYDERVDYARAARAAWWGREFDVADGRGGVMRVPLFPPDQAQLITQNEEMVLLNRAKQLGIPIGSVVAALASSWGYDAWKSQQGNVQQNGNGLRSVQPQVMPSANDRLEQIQRGQAVQGLGRVQSGEQNGATAWQTMSNVEFKAFVGNMPEDQYLSMIQDPRFGKHFEKRVGEIDMTEAA